ncbi:hypothetical protein ACF5W4_09390 [Bacillota bacterium Lsc_1132]
MKKQKETEQKEHMLAPGMNLDQELEEHASEDEIKKGEYTSVTTLSYDEVDPT